MYIFFHFCIKKFSMSSVWNLDKQIKALFKPEMPFSLIETLRKASYVFRAWFEAEASEQSDSLRGSR